MAPTTTNQSSLCCNSSFDPLICLEILRFLPHSEWPTTQPYLISKTFCAAFNSEGFTREFLKNNLQLDQLDELEATIDEMKREFNSAAGADEASLRRSTADEMQKKKRKKIADDDDENLEFINHPPQNLRQVMKMFVGCSLGGGGDEIIVKDRVVQKMEQFTKTRDQELLNSVSTLIKQLKSSIAICDSYQSLMEGSCENVNYFVGKNYDECNEIPAELLPTLFQKVKRVFVTSSKDESSTGFESCRNKVLVFTNCGYPLLIKTFYSSTVDSYRSNHTLEERVFIYSKELFSHRKHSNEHGYFDTEFSSSKSNSLMKKMEELILCADFSTLVKEKLKLSSTTNDKQKKNNSNNTCETITAAVKDGLIYEFIQIAFGSKHLHFLLESDEWAPLQANTTVDDYVQEEENSQRKKPKKKKK